MAPLEPGAMISALFTGSHQIWALILEQKSHRAYSYFKTCVMKAVRRLKQTDFKLVGFSPPFEALC